MVNHIGIIPKKYQCSSCEKEITAPKHCGKPMNFIGEVYETAYWICWKGEHQPCCNRDSVIDFESCCDSPKLEVKDGVQPDQVLL